MQIEPKIIIVPDVHGRTFWKDITNYGCDIVFLGDYVDPYAHEGISKDDAIANFMEILDFARNHDNVHLLLGNHDAGYAIGKDVCQCRMDYTHYEELASMFEDDRDLFHICYDTDINGERYVLSHAGFHPWWMNNFNNEITPETINGLMWKQLGHTALNYYSMWRGGFTVAGSPIWADIREFMDTDLSELGYKQIVGHTQLNEYVLGNGYITCVDLRRPFYLDNEGVLMEMDGKPVEIVSFNK